MNKKLTVHTERLDHRTRLHIQLHHVIEYNKYTFSIVFLDEQGEYGGYDGNGQMYETQAAGHADAYIEYITQHRIDSD